MATKEDFANAYRKFPPGKSEFFYMKYLSIHNIHHHSFIEILIILSLFLPFIIEIIFCCLNLSIVYKLIPTLFYVFSFALFGVYWSIIWYKRKKRFKKIREYLGVSKKEYKELIEAYFYNRYPSTKEYLQFNCKTKNNDDKCQKKNYC